MNTNRTTPKVISSNKNKTAEQQPIRVKNYTEQLIRAKTSPIPNRKPLRKPPPINNSIVARTTPLINQLTARTTPTPINKTPSFCSESTSCCSSFLSSVSPITQNTLIRNPVQLIQKNSPYQNQNHKHFQTTSASNSLNGHLSQSSSSETHPSYTAFHSIASERQPSTNNKPKKQNNLLLNETQNFPLLSPQFNRSPSVPANPNPLLLPPQLNQSNHVIDDQFDSARVNRKILDLEISNASLLAINGALERTKVNQQNEIRTLKKKLQLYESNNSDNSQGTSWSKRDAHERKNSINVSKKGSSQGSQLLDEDQGEEEQDLLSLDDLISQDLEFGHIIQSIDHMISTATRAINFRPLMNTSSSTDTNAMTTATTKDSDRKIPDQNFSQPIGKSTKVLNPIQAQRFLSQLDTIHHHFSDLDLHPLRLDDDHQDLYLDHPSAIDH